MENKKQIKVAVNGAGYAGKAAIQQALDSRNSEIFVIETLKGQAERIIANRLPRKLEKYKEEYELILQKKSKLSAKKRKDIVNLFEKYYNKIKNESKRIL